MDKKAIVFSETMERKFQALAWKEGVIKTPEIHKDQVDKIQKENITRDEESQINANIFLNPHIRFPISNEFDLEPTIKNLFIEKSRPINEKKMFKDFDLLISLVMARNPGLAIDTILGSLEEYVAIETKVIDSFGSIPTRQLNDDLFTFGHSIATAISGKPPLATTQDQEDLFIKFEASSKKIQPIRSAYYELEKVFNRSNIGDSVVIDPVLKSNYMDFLDDSFNSHGQLEEIDLFYIFIKELRTLPIGRSIEETIELSNTKVGDALRKRIGELHNLFLSGELSGIEKIQDQIKQDIHEYKLLTSKLLSPNRLSEITDLTLTGLGLVPVVGNFAAFAGLAKISAKIDEENSIRRKIGNKIWVEYRGSTI